MRTLTCISKDSYGYENESLDFFYNNFKVFTQYNQKLNRGGKTLILREIATSEDLISSGKYIKESWFRKIVSTLKAHNYEISIDDIKGAINKQRVLNLKKHIGNIIEVQTAIKKELEKEEKRIIHLRKRVKENSSLIKVYQEELKIAQL